MFFFFVIYANSNNSNIFKVMFMKNKALVVSGNAPSLTEIDYARLPLEYDVFRVNLFHFEEKYFLGKKITAAFVLTHHILENYYTLKNLIQNQEYVIDNIIAHTFGLPNHDCPHFMQNASFFPDVIMGHDFFKHIKEFEIYMKYNFLYNYAVATSGIYACAIGVAMGYREIYIAGIDFYTQGDFTYGFDIKQKNFLTIAPHFALNKPVFETWHSTDTDLKVLDFLAKTYNVNFYALCPKSPLAKSIPLAPITHNTYIPEEKPKNYTKDMLLPPKKAYQTYGIKPSSADSYFVTEPRSSNMILNIMRDLFFLPKAIKQEYKRKMQKREAKKFQKGLGL